MARVTVEDCVTIIPNRFELCLVASNRAKSILSGAVTTLNRKEKPPVIALREIGDGLIDVENVKKNIVNNVKNKGSADYNQITDIDTAELIEEGVESQGLTLKDDIFLQDNLNIDD